MHNNVKVNETTRFLQQTATQYTTKYAPKRMHPGSARDPTAFFSIMSRKSSIRSSLISASTTMQIGMAAREVVEKVDRDAGTARAEWRLLWDVWGAKAVAV